MSMHIAVAPSQRGIGRLVVPAPIVRAIPADAAFEIELTEEGILYRFTGLTERKMGKQFSDVADVPSWVKNGGAA